MQANSAKTTGDIIKDLIAIGYRKSGSVLIQGGDIRGKSQACSCLRVFGMDREINLTMPLTGAYLNLDSGFDYKHNRKCIFNAGMIPNIKENPHHRKHTKRGRKRLFDEAIHALRTRVDRTFAWEDKFKWVLLRFEHIQQRHFGRNCWRTP